MGVRFNTCLICSKASAKYTVALSPKDQLRPLERMMEKRQRGY
jgi:hypothetical protein